MLSVALLACATAAPAAAQYGQGYFGKNKVQYRDFDWKVYHSPHFDVYYYTESEQLLQKVVSFAESAYDLLSREFDYQIKEPTPLIFYETHSAFEQNNIILNFIPEGIGAFATPARFRMVLPVDLPDPELMELVLHELTHIFQYHMLFQGNLTKAVATVPPTWVMEGMASYMAKDEDQRDKMFLRDAVVNDRIPSVSQNFQGFFAYRFGHAVFDFMEERWGKEGFLDFLYELRNTIGSRVDRAIERSFRLEPEEFDSEFRRWLRRKYLPQLVETGEPADFGRLFRVEQAGSQEISPTASPSGDLVASFSTFKGDVDVVLFDARRRRFLRNLTSGYSNDYQYLVAQELALGRKHGRDLDFSPDGNHIAVFAKRERGRDLLLIDVLKGGIARSFTMPEIEQQTSPAWSPDGRKVAFAGHQGGQFDIFVLDLESGQFTNLTNDPIFDGAPDFSPDGKSIAFVSVVGAGFGKLFRVDLASPAQRFQLTGGESNENDPAYSPDGARLYFTSDRDGAENIYSLDVASGELEQWTDVVTGAFMPTVLAAGEDEGERLVYTGFWKGRFDLYVNEVEEPAAEPTTVDVAVTPVIAQDIPAFEPDIQVAIDDANKGPYRGFKFFLEDAQSFVGVDDDQTVVGRVLLTFSDYLGDRRIFAFLDSIDSFSNFDIIYLDLSRRLQWQVHLFDDRTFFFIDDPLRQDIRGREVFQQTGVIGSLIFPFTFYTRFEVGAGYLYRQFHVPVQTRDPNTGQTFLDFIEIEDDFPLATSALVGDSTLFAPWGPIGGRRWRLDLFYAPDLDESGTLTSSADLEVRQYIPLTQRSNLALRGFAGASEGNRANFLRLGGLDTVRGVPFRSMIGDTGFFANVELRFPLIDILATPFLAFQNIRGVVFLDVGGTWFREFDSFSLLDEEDRLEDGVSSYGFGVTAGLFGLDLNWDFARRWDFHDGLDDGYATSFWVGRRF